MQDASLRDDTFDAPYWRALVDGRLVMQHCGECGRWAWPAVCRCGDCGAWNPPWEEIAFEGRLFSWAATYHPFGGTEGIGVPYTSVLVELPQAGGRRLLGLLEGDEAGLKLNASMRGRPSETAFGDEKIPSIRWRLA